jgi:CubicO group peptidase (beta-lactamase class C family)
VGQQLWLPAIESIPALLAELAERPQLQPFTAETLASFKAYVETTRQRYEIPGAAVVVIYEGQIIMAEGFGVREVGRSEPVTPETIFPIGSTSKAFNSTMIATMMDEELVSWDQPVVELWPDFMLSDLAHTRQMRLRNLLNMGSGLPRRDLLWSGANLTAEQLMATLPDIPIYYDFGQRYYYNNQLVATGGYVATLAAGGRFGQLQADYSQLLQQRVFDPLGMGSATTSAEVALANPNHAIPHDLNLYGEVVPTHYHLDESITPAGGVYANALDMAKFLQMQLNEGVTGSGRRIVSAANVRETHRPQTPVTNEISYAMGWFVEDFRGVDLIWHDGDVLGVHAQMVMIPEAELGMVVLSNRILGTMYSAGLQYRLVELAYDLSPKAEAVYNDIWANFVNAIVDIRANLSPTVDPAAVDPLLGLYADGWAIELRGDRLYATRGSYEWHLLPAPEGHFVVNNGYGIGINLYLEPDESSGIMTMKFTLPTGETGVYEKVGG